MNSLTPAQQMMVDDGFPPELFFTIEERRAHWKGRKLTIQGSGFRKIDKAEERIRKQLEREQAKLKAEREAARLKALRERFR